MMEGQALTASSRNGDPDFPGVLRIVSERHRVAVNPDGTRYQLQQRIEAPEGEVWVPRSYASLSALLKAQASKVQGLADACNGLPEKPSLAVPEKMRTERAEILERISETDWRRNHYGRVIRQSGNIRLAVDPAGADYRLQWISAPEFEAGGSDNWRTLVKGPLLHSLKYYLETTQFLYSEGGRGEFLQRSEALFEGFPDLVTDGYWQELPDRYEPRP